MEVEDSVLGGQSLTIDSQWKVYKQRSDSLPPHHRAFFRIAIRNSNW